MQFLKGFFYLTKMALIDLKSLAILYVICVIFPLSRDLIVLIAC